MAMAGLRAVALEKYAPAREHLLPFCQYTFPGYQVAPHLELIAGALEEVVRGENGRLIIEAPPRHSKSETVSIRFPAWLLCKDPTKRVISASYGENLANETGRKVRNIVDTQTLFSGVSLAADSKAKNLWHTDKGGQFLSVGIGSGVVGFGGDVIIVDDPFKKREEAESVIQRDGVHNWWQSEIVTRQERGTAFVIVMHRWHEDDLVGRVLAEEPGRWKVLHLPALAEEGDVLGRQVGEALWPWRWSVEELLELRRQVGERNWTSLFQQRPAPAQGAIFKWWPRYQTLPSCSQIVIGIDTAYSDSAQADYTAWAAWGWDGFSAYLIEADRFRGEIPDAERQISYFVNKMKQQHPRASVKVAYRVRVAIDRVAAQHIRRGPASLQVVDGHAPTRINMGVPVVEVKLPSGNSKEEIANIVATEFEGGRALIPERASWLDPWLDEHKMFPAGANDDFVETTNAVLWYLFRRQPYVQPVPTRVVSRW